MGEGLPDFRDGQVEKWGQKWKNAQLTRDLKRTCYCLFLNGNDTIHFTILIPNALFGSRIEPEN